MTRTHAARALAAAAMILALGLTGCAGGGDAPTNTASSAPAGSSSPGPATAMPSEEPTAGATCDDVLTADAYTKLEADGLVPRESSATDTIAGQIAEQGGLVCSWGKPQSDIILDVRQAMVAGDATAWTNALAAAGYTQTDDPVPGAWTGPVDPGNGLAPIVVVDDDTVTFVSAPTFAEWIRPGV